MSYAILELIEEQRIFQAIWAVVQPNIFNKVDKVQFNVVLVNMDTEEKYLSLARDAKVTESMNIEMKTSFLLNVQTIVL